MKIKKSNLLQSLLFLISPIACLPFSLFGVLKRRSFSILIIVLIFSFLSYLYIPSAANDRLSYFFFHELAKESSWDRIFTELTVHPDFILYLLIAVFAKLNLSFQFVAALQCFISFGIPLYIFQQFFRKKSNYFASFLLVLFSTNLLALFSGMRFILAASFVLLAYYKGFYLKQKRTGFIVLTLAGFTHFSTFLFFVPYLFFLFLGKKKNFIRALFVLSFFLLIMPKDFVYNVLSSIGFVGENIANKFDAYLGSGDDFIEGGFASSSSFIIIYWGGMLWLYFSYLYLLITIKRKSSLRSLIYCNIAVLNVFFQATTVFERYSIVLQFLFSILIIYETVKLKRLYVLYVFMFLYSIRFIFQIIIMRYNIEASYYNKEALFFITALLKQVTSNDFL